MPDTPLPDSAAQPNTGDMSIFGPRHLTRLMIAIMVVISCVIFTYGARFVNWPSERGYRGSMAQPPMALGGFLVALVLLIICAGLGTLVLSRRYFLAGLMSATAGLTVWAVRGGTMSYVLFNAQNSGANAHVFLQLLGELIVLFAVIGGIWNVLWNRQPHSTLAQQPEKGDGRSAGAALVAQAALMSVFVLILVATPQKKQVLAGVFVAGLASTALAETFFADRTAGRWYWIGPLVAGALGYIANFISPAGLETGDMTGMFGALARALPLDYASLGCAGALMGYWWMMPEEDEATEGIVEPAK
jgi:hypothetical protein